MVARGEAVGVDGLASGVGEATGGDGSAFVVRRESAAVPVGVEEEVEADDEEDILDEA